MSSKQSTSQSKTVPVKSFLEKIVVNVGVGRLSQQSHFEDKILGTVIKEVALIAGQNPQARRLRKSIAGFKAREGQIVGLRTTLRGAKMVDFFQRLINIVIPRIRDFRGIDTKVVDTAGVLNIGIKEHLVFPEINPEESMRTFSIGVNVVPRTKDRQKALACYRSLGVPLKKEKVNK